MASSDQAVADRRQYGDHRPYLVPPARLADLTGPTAGSIELAITIDWGPKRVYDIGRDADRRIVCERVLREAATTEEVSRLMVSSSSWCGSGCFSLSVVPRLSEERFPEL